MNHVTIKQNHADGLVDMEAYACDLWRWLWEHRPCRVHVRGRSYSLEHPATRLEQLMSHIDELMPIV